MSFKFSDLLHKMFGNKADGDQAEQNDAVVEMDRKALTIAVIKDFETKKRTGDAIAGMWDNIADLLVEGLGPEDEMDDREAEYVETVRSVAQIIRDTNTFSDRVSITQSHIDTLYAGRDLVYDAKNVIAATAAKLPDGAKGDFFIGEDEMGEEQLYFPRSEFEKAIDAKEIKLSEFAFKLNDTLGPHASPGVEPGRLDL